jgi:hypothetical protein
MRMSRRERRKAASPTSPAEYGSVAANENSVAAMNLERPRSPLGKAIWAPPHPRKLAKPKDETFRLPDPARSPIPAAYQFSDKAVEGRGKLRKNALITFALAILVQGILIVTCDVAKPAKTVFIIELTLLVGFILRSVPAK